MTSPISALGYSPMATPATDTTGTTGTTGTTDTTGTTGTSTTSSAANSPMLDPQAFLQLLVAQLKYQDPTNPVDTSTFMNQTAMLSQVQTMSSMSSTLNTLVSSQQAQAATGLLGKHITYLDANGLRATGVVDSANLLSSGATVQVGGVTVPLASVVGVSDGTTTTT
jgi:flagellar basal-body rod modification protein FlgD